MRKILLSFAHPDDESFTSAGTIAKYVKAGWEADLLCATRGEVGNSGEYGEVTKEALGDIRQKELQSAATLLGINSVTFFGYMDGSLSGEEPGELEDKIYQKMIELMPDVVITFDTLGISNHPDHIKICFATTFAFQKYAKWIEEQLVEHPEFSDETHPKLYYACVPQTIITHLIQKKIFSAESFGKKWRGTPDKKVTTVISIKEHVPIKKQALRMHKTQTDDIERFLSLPSNALITQEYFILRMHGTKEVFMGKNDRVSSKL